MSRRNRTGFRVPIVLAGAFFSSLGLGAGDTLGQEPPPAPAPEFQRWSGAGLRVELAPLTHEQALAFFLGRGFSSATARHIVGTGCIFRSSIGNQAVQTGSPSVTLDLRQWRVDRGDGPRPLRLIDDWAARWDPAEVPKAAGNAFRWALFPIQQTFGPSDYNWGLFTFGLPPASQFDLHMRWRLNGTEQHATLTGLVCADGNTD